MTITLIRSGQHLEGLRCLQKITETYFGEKETSVGPAVTVALAHLTRLGGILRSNPIPKSDTNFPDFNAHIYEDILENAQPKAVPILTFYFLAEAYEVLDNQLDAHFCLKTALSFNPENEWDKRIVPLLIKKSLDTAIDSDNNHSLFKLCVELTLKCRSLGIEASLSNLSQLLFNQVDIGFENGMPLNSIETFLELVEETLVDSELDRDHWESEILIRRGRLSLAYNGEQSTSIDLYRKGLAKGIASQNASAILGAAHALGFELAFASISMEELAKYHFELIRGVEIQATDNNQLRGIGANLFTLWRKMVYRRLLASDLKIKKYLYDSAREMDKANIPDNQAGFVMVLLLSSLFNHIGPSVDWAKGQLEFHSGLPDHVTSLLDPPFQKKVRGS